MIIDTKRQAIDWLKSCDDAPPRGSLFAAMNAAQEDGDDEAWRVLCDAWERLYG